MKGSTENQYGQYKRWTKKEINLLKKSYALSKGQRKINWLPELLKTRTSRQCHSKAGIRCGLKITRNSYLGYYDELNLKNISKEELAYLAGIIDGEGNFESRVTHNYRNRPCCKVNITNTSLELMKWVKQRIGGSIYKKVPVLKLDGSGYRKQQYEYHLYGKRPMLSLLKTLLPYLIVKRKLAEEIINYIEKNLKSNKLN